MKTLDVRHLLQVCVCGHYRIDHVRLKDYPDMLRCPICYEDGRVCVGFLSKDSGWKKVTL
ncbi:MAG: hypothetical protein E6L03_10485 [Thaumarchaeota archaeon]|nr:MAG: hypothetical protein E6L03_10485 [Nitrososphaerota archaeon]